VADPTLRGTTQAQALPIGDTEEVVVRMGRDPAGNLVVQQVLSPTLSPEQQEELRRAFAVGDWKRKAPAPTPTGSWIETLEKNKP